MFTLQSWLWYLAVGMYSDNLGATCASQSQLAMLALSMVSKSVTVPHSRLQIAFPGINIAPHSEALHRPKQDLSLPRYQGCLHQPFPLPGSWP